jgi:hypothetical protein
VSLRRVAKQDRVLFHYNGHGVPRPTPNGEIWVFNKNYTQYIPLSVYDLQVSDTSRVARGTDGRTRDAQSAGRLWTGAGFGPGRAGPASTL